MKQFNEYNELVEATKYGAIYEPQNIKTYADALDPEVLIKGVGRLLLSQVKRRIAEILKGMESDAKVSMRSPDLQVGEEMLGKIEKRLIYFVGALADVEVEMRRPQYKRKLTTLKKKER